MTDEKQVREYDKFLIRLPDGMRDRIAAAAKANKRTMNAEVVARLDASFGAIITAEEAARREYAALEHRINMMESDLVQLREAQVNHMGRSSSRTSDTK